MKLFKIKLPFISVKEHNEIIEKIKSEFLEYLAEEATFEDIENIQQKDRIRYDATDRSYVYEIADVKEDTWSAVGGNANTARAQTVSELWTMQDAAFNKVHSDPHARAIVDNIQRYTIGRGLKFEAASKDVQKVLNDFWYVNGMDLRQKSFIRSTFIEGELFILYFINYATGNVRIRRVRSSEITDIETHPEDIQTILTYKREYSANSEYYVVYYPDIGYYDQLVDTFTGARSAYSDSFSKNKMIQFVKYGEEDEVRGRVPMDSVLMFLKLYYNFLIDRARLIHERSKVVWIKKVLGRGKEIKNLKPMRSPKGGSMLIETDTVSYRIERPNLESSEAKQDGLALLYAIGSGVTMPLHILDQRTSESVYSSLRKADSPWAQAIIDNQDFWAAQFDKMLRVAIKANVEAGVLPEKVRVPKYDEDKLVEAMDLINRMVVDGEDSEKIVREVSPILEGAHTVISMPTVEVPITKIFPDVVKEDYLQQAKVLQIHQQMGIASQRTLAEKAGYDWERELFRMAQNIGDSSNGKKAKAKK